MPLAVQQEQQQPPTFMRGRVWAHTVLGGKSQPAQVCRGPGRQSSRTLISWRRSQRWPPRRPPRRQPPPWPTRRPWLLPPLGWRRRRRRRRRQLRLRRLQTTCRTCLWDLLGNGRSSIVNLTRLDRAHHRRANFPNGRTMCGGHSACSLRQREEQPARGLARGGRRRCPRRSALVLCRLGRTLRRDCTPGRGAWSLQRPPHRQRCGCCGRIQCAPTRLYRRHLGRRRPGPRLAMPHKKIAPDRPGVQRIGRQAAALLRQVGWLSAPRAALRGGGHGASPVVTTTAAQTAAIMMRRVRRSPATAPQSASRLAQSTGGAVTTTVAAHRGRVHGGAIARRVPPSCNDGTACICGRAVTARGSPLPREELPHPRRRHGRFPRPATLGGRAPTIRARLIVNLTRL
eukprot:COSAG01_NODE_7433_length_3213_cov_1.156390_2_plen_400_part_00